VANRYTSDQNANEPKGTEMSNITLDQARAIIAGTLAEGHKQGFMPLSVVVLDAGGHLTAFEREDNSANKRFEIAYAKAHGCISIGKGGRWLEMMAENRPAFISSVASAFGGTLIPVGGGILVNDSSGATIGAVGISGDNSDNDETAGIGGITSAGLVAEIN
jgi:uncharacterized protein GlcG (DUF336 family)